MITLEAGGVVGPPPCGIPLNVEKTRENEPLEPRNRTLQLETDTKTDTIFNGLEEAGVGSKWRQA